MKIGKVSSAEVAYTQHNHAVAFSSEEYGNVVRLYVV